MHGGDPHRTRWRPHATPGLTSTPPVPVFKGMTYERWHLDGDRKFAVRGVKYGVPSRAQFKYSGDRLWVLLDGLAYCLTEHGSVVLHDRDRRRLASRWDSI